MEGWGDEVGGNSAGCRGYDPVGAENWMEDARVGGGGLGTSGTVLSLFEVLSSAGASSWKALSSVRGLASGAASEVSEHAEEWLGSADPVMESLGVEVLLWFVLSVDVRRGREVRVGWKDLNRFLWICWTMRTMVGIMAIAAEAREKRVMEVGSMVLVEEGRVGSETMDWMGWKRGRDGRERCG